MAKRALLAHFTLCAFVVVVVVVVVVVIRKFGGFTTIYGQVSLTRKI